MFLDIYSEIRWRWRRLIPIYFLSITPVEIPQPQSALLCTRHKSKTNETNTKQNSAWAQANSAAVRHCWGSHLIPNSYREMPNLNIYEAAELQQQKTEYVQFPISQHWHLPSVLQALMYLLLKTGHHSSLSHSLSANVLQVNSVVNTSWQNEVYVLCNNTHCHSFKEKTLQGQPAPVWHNYCFAKRNRGLAAVRVLPTFSPSARLLTSILRHIWRLIGLSDCSGPDNLNTNTLCGEQKAGGSWRKRSQVTPLQKLYTKWVKPN